MFQKKRIQELEKRVSVLEDITMEQRLLIAELINCFKIICNKEQIDIDEIKKLDIRKD